jgi:hypothetical protein
LATFARAKIWLEILRLTVLSETGSHGLAPSKLKSSSSHQTLAKLEVEKRKCRIANDDFQIALAVVLKQHIRRIASEAAHICCQ